jgi:hypothetical protein
VAPGDEILVRLPIPPMPAPGVITVEVGALQEGVAWYDSWLPVELDVRIGRRVVIATDPEDETRRRTAALLALLARELPDVVPSVVQMDAGPIAIDSDLPLIDAREDLDPVRVLARLAEVLHPPPPLT